jgi:hypothetical protein
VTVNTHIFFGLIFTKKQYGAQPCVEKMQFIFFVPPKEELEGTLHPQKFGCTPKNEGKRVHVPPDEKTCGHAEERKLIVNKHERHTSNTTNTQTQILWRTELNVHFMRRNV